MWSYFASTFVDFEIDKNQVIFVYKVLNVEEQGCEEWDDWYDWAEKKATEEYDKGVALVVSKIILVFILEWLPKNWVLILIIIIMFH
jgi:hypothetical protein